MHKIFIIITIALLNINLYTYSTAAEQNNPLLKQDWSFQKFFGKFDRASLQRGYQVYTEVCASCHSMKYLHYRNLSEQGGPEFSIDQAKAIASNIEDFPEPVSPIIPIFSPFKILKFISFIKKLF